MFFKFNSKSKKIVTVLKTVFTKQTLLFGLKSKNVFLKKVIKKSLNLPFSSLVCSASLFAQDRQDLSELDAPLVPNPNPLFKTKTLNLNASQLVPPSFPGNSPWPSVLPSNESHSWHSSRVSAVAPDVLDSKRASDDNGAHSNNEVSASTVVPSRVGAGLSNLGNTCFLNAILQCLTHTVPLVLGLRSCNHSTACAGHTDGFCVICALREHIQSSLVASGADLSPFKFVENLNHFSSIFRRYQQEDAHEFLQRALDKLESCFLDLKNNNISSEDDNLVEKVFGGRLISKVC